MMFAGHDIIHAVQFVEKEHRPQFRKYSGEPYLVHLLSVAKMVSCAVFEKELEDMREKMIIAALLHDVVEDTPILIDEVYGWFGSDVGRFVAELTDPPLSAGNRAKRKEITRERLKTASNAAKVIKCADIIDNMHSIVACDPDFSKVFLKEVGYLIPLLETPRSSLHKELIEKHAAFMSKGTPTLQL